MPGVVAEATSTEMPRAIRIAASQMIVRNSAVVHAGMGELDHAWAPRGKGSTR